MLGKQGQTEACINLQGQVNEVLGADPSKNRPVWTGMGMKAAFSTRKDPIILLSNVTFHDTMRH